MRFIDKKDLVELGFKQNQAVTIIREAKFYLVKMGYPYYNNKRLGLVPEFAIKEILGCPLSEMQEEK